MTVQGVASAAAASVAIPAHQIGDLICVFVRRASNTWPTVPGPFTTVPTWLPTQYGGANTLSMGGWYAVANASNHTTGTWTNADQIIVMVLRPDAGKALDVNAAQAGTTNGNATQTIVYPSLGLARTDGSSWVVRCGTRGTAASTVATPPTNYINRAVQPAAASALIAVHTRAGVTSNPTQDTVSTTGTNAAYRAISFEVLETALAPADQTVIDDFNRADGLADAGAGANIWLGSTPILVGETAPQIFSNTLGIPTSSPKSLVSKAMLKDSFDLLIDCTAADSSFPILNFYFCLTGYNTATRNAYNLAIAQGGANTWELQKYVNGSFTQLITGTSVLPAVGDTIWLSKRGTTIRAYSRVSAGNWVPVLSYVDSTFSGPAQFGLRLINSSGRRWDNLRGGPMYVPPQSVVVI